ncbi:MAG: response regulator [Planctomycetota bacterium]|jgi:DNA-binding response OmpR family regulator
MNKTILIVEDERNFQEFYAAILEDTDYEIIRAYDGGEALVELEEKKPDLIILDILLDMVTGDTLFLYLKSMPEYADIPIIIVSNTSKHNYESLLAMDTRLVFIEKALVMENLITEIKAKIG